jgi:hypothetical protein
MEPALNLFFFNLKKKKGISGISREDSSMELVALQNREHLDCENISLYSTVQSTPKI